MRIFFTPLKGVLHQATQVQKPYKCDKNIAWVYAITGRLRQEVNSILTFLQPATVAWNLYTGYLIPTEDPVKETSQKNQWSSYLVYSVLFWHNGGWLVS